MKFLCTESYNRQASLFFSRGIEENKHNRETKLSPTKKENSPAFIYPNHFILFFFFCCMQQCESEESKEVTKGVEENWAHRWLIIFYKYRRRTWKWNAEEKMGRERGAKKNEDRVMKSICPKWRGNQKRFTKKGLIEPSHVHGTIFTRHTVRSPKWNEKNSNLQILWRYIINVVVYVQFTPFGKQRKKLGLTLDEESHVQ